MAKDQSSEFASSEATAPIGGERSAAATTRQTGFFGHPFGLATLFLTEFWERFSYYGMRAILVLFMVAAADATFNPGLGYSLADAGAIYGLYTSLVYIVSLPGGWLADRLLGQRRSVLYGGLIIAAGELTLAIPNQVAFFIGLVLIIIGTGMLKPNISTMVGQLYAPEDERRDAGFSLFYMGINMGALFAPLLVGYVGQTINWHYGFLLAGIGMLFGVGIYVFMGRHLGEAGLHPAVQQTEASRQKDIKSFVYGLIGVAVVVGLVFLASSAGLFEITIQRLAGAYGIILLLVVIGVFVWLFVGNEWTKEERARLATILFLFIAAVVFFGAFEQAGSTLNLVAKDLTDRSVPGWVADLFNLRTGEFPESWLQAANPLFIILFAPLFALMWVRLGKHNPSSPVKFGFGLFFLAMGFVVLWLGTSSAVATGSMSAWWLVGTYLFHTIGELSLSPVGLSAMTKLAPARIASFIMGVWFMASSTGNYLGGYLTRYYAEWGAPPFFRSVVIFVLAGAVVVFVLARSINKMLARSRQA